MSTQQPSGDVQNEKKKESKSITSFASKMKTKMFGKKKDKDKEKERERSSTIPMRPVSLSDYFDLPPILKKCLDYLKQEKNLMMDCYGSTFSLTEVQKIQTMFEQSDIESVSLQALNPNDVSGYLRRWFRNLTDPLFSYNLYDRWIAVQSMDDLEEQLEEIKNISQLLHTTHYLTMQALFDYFRLLLAYSQYNHLTSSSIGFLWQPNLLKNETDDTMKSLKLNNNGTLTGNLVSIIIDNYNNIFTEDYFPSPLVSSEFMSQISPESPRQSPINPTPLSVPSNDTVDSQLSPTISPTNPEFPSNQTEQNNRPGSGKLKNADNGKDLSPIIIPPNGSNAKGYSSVPVTPSLFSPTNSKPNQFSSSNPSTPNLPPSKGQLVVINGYTHGYAICDYNDQAEGRLNFVKDEKIWVTKKHDDGWWEGWKRGKRGFFPHNYIVEFKV